MSTLVVVTGLQGSGKSTVGRILAERLNALLLRSDVIRRELFDVRHYTQDETNVVFNTMFDRARSYLSEGKNVILDAVFAKKSERQTIREIAKNTGSAFILIEVICDESILKKRIEQRSGDASEGEFEDYLKFKKIFEPIAEDHVLINNSGTRVDLQVSLKTLELN